MSDKEEFKVPTRAKDVIVFSGEEASLAFSFDKDELLGRKPPAPTPCNYCGKETLKRCSKCFIVYACSKKCFKKMWKEHKPLCEKVQMHRHEESLKEEAADDIRMLWWQNPQTNSKLFPAYTKHTLYQLGEEPYLSKIKKNRKFVLEWLLRNASTWKKKIIFNADNRIHSVDDYAKISLEAMTSNKLFFLTFDLRKPWCIYHANHEAEKKKKNQFRGELAYMHLGFWVLVGDSHAYASGFSDQLKFKMSVQNVMKTCDTREAQQCQQCLKFVDMITLTCSRCMTAICSSCEKRATSFHDDGTSTYKCPKCCKDITNKHPTSFYVDGESNKGETYSKFEIEYRNLLLLNNYEKVVGKPPKLHRTIREIVTFIKKKKKKKISQSQREEIEDSVKHMLSNKEQREIAVTNAIESSAIQNLILETKKTSVKSGAYHLIDDTSCEYGQTVPGTKFVWGWNYNCEEPQLLLAKDYDNVEKVQLATEDFKFVSENVGPQEFRKMMRLASCGDAKQFEKWDMPSKQRDTSSEDFLTGVKANIKQMLITYLRRR